MPNGRVKWYDSQKNYGFVTTDKGVDVFLHKSALPEGIDSIPKGALLEFEIIKSKKSNKDEARHVRILTTTQRG